VPPDPPPAPRAHRFEAKLPALLLHDGDELSCVAENLSRSGLLLTGRADWPASDTFTLILKSPQADLQVGLRVRVARRDPHAVTSQLAVEFEDLDAERREGIEFLLRRVIEGRATAPGLPVIPPGTPPHEAKKILDTVPMVLRTSLAARAGPADRETLLHDHHPAVLEGLARNPFLLAHEARVLAALPHASPVAISILAGDGRWTGNQEIRILLLTHPHATPAVAQHLAGTLGREALARAMLRPGLNAAARMAIQKRLAGAQRG
jgi:hypothetical protein